MTKIEELKQMAEASNVPYYPRLAVWGEDNDAEFIKAANPQTILALLDLVEMQHEQLRLVTINLRKGMSRSIQNLQAKENCEALAAFEVWNKP